MNWCMINDIKQNNLSNQPLDILSYLHPHPPTTQKYVFDPEEENIYFLCAWGKSL